MWIVEPRELKTAAGAPSGTYHLVASSGESVVPCCTHGHPTPAAAARCPEGREEAARLTGARPPAPKLAVETALRIARARAERHSYELILPGDPRREAVVHGLAAAHALTGSGWSLDYAREHVGVALPGVGDFARTLLAQVPYVGALLAEVAGTVERPQVYLSPVAMRDGGTLLGQLLHEEGHIGQIRVGGLPWCLAYGAIGEVKAGAEAPCYTADVAVRARVNGDSARALYDGALEALRAYGLGDDIALAESILRSGLVSLEAGADPGGIGAEVEAEIARLTAVPQ